jgi:hypothetical protein
MKATTVRAAAVKATRIETPQPMAAVDVVASPADGAARVQRVDVAIQVLGILSGGAPPVLQP